MEQLRDSYALDSLVILAKSLGFDGEPAHIDLATHREQYTLGIIQKWLMSNGIVVLSGYGIMDNTYRWWCFNPASGIMSEAESFASSYDDAIEAGLREGCMMLKELQDASKVLDGRT
jgi:hypothetical protein